jgi:hypothetical protein
MRTETINGVEYNLAPATVGSLEAFALAGKQGLQYNIGLVAQALYSGGDKTITEDKVRDMPAVEVFIPLLNAVREMNGLKVAEEKAAAPGEGEAPEAAPGSTSTTSSGA